MIIAIVGMCGSGKSTCVRIIKEITNFETIYFGGLVIDELDSRGLERNPKNEREVREDLRKKEGVGILAKLVIAKIDRLGLNEIILDGVYSTTEYKILKEKYKDQIKFIAIHTDKEIRYKRLENRGERPLTSNEVDDRDMSEILNLEKGGPIALADYHIINNADDKTLVHNLSVCLKEILI